MQILLILDAQYIEKTFRLDPFFSHCQLEVNTLTYQGQECWISTSGLVSLSLSQTCFEVIALSCLKGEFMRKERDT